MAHHREYITAKNIYDVCVTLGLENLEALCQECHNREHHKSRPARGYVFDSDGEIMYSPPLSE